QRIRRCGPNATFRTRLQQCEGDWWPLSPRCYRVAHAARLGTDTEICDTVRLTSVRLNPASAEDWNRRCDPKLGAANGLVAPQDDAVHCRLLFVALAPALLPCS